MKALKTLMILILWAGIASAAPFLVADTPPAEEQITRYSFKAEEMVKDPVTGIWSTTGIFIIDILNHPAQLNGSLSYDLKDIPPGKYEWTAKACNIWGCSDPSNPYISPEDVGKPMNLKLIP